MLTLIAHDYIRVEDIDAVLPLYRELVECTHTEPLNLSYVLHHDLEDPGHFVFIETWPDSDALDVHFATEHFQRLVPQIAAYQRAASVHTRLAEVFPGL